jgi:copper chaperone
MSTSTTETFTVTGMTCDHCVRSVTEEVGAVDGVTDVQVDLASGRVEVASSRPLTVEKVREAVEEAGYRLAEA